MANQEHLDILKQGVEVWNRWRKEHLGIFPDLTFADLSFADLRGANLNRANLSRADLNRANLRGVHLRGAELGRANLIKLDETLVQTNLPWAANIRRTRHMGDFTNWKNHGDYQKGLNRLLRDLKASS